MSLRAVHRGIARLVVSGLLASTAGTVAAVAAPTAAFAESSYTMESEFISKMNSAREANGLHPYAVASDLTSIARQHSQQMAAKQTLYHNPNLTTEVKNWQAVGENVGEGPTVSDIHQAFMNSPEHRANILDHDFTQVGVGVTVDGNGTIWVTEDFREPMQSSSSSSGSGSSSGSTTTQTTTRHATSTRSSTSAAPTSQPASTASSTASSTPTASTPSRPRPTLSPRARLLLRLHHVRTTAPRVRPVDPVAGAFDYVDTLATLTG